MLVKKALAVRQIGRKNFSLWQDTFHSGSITKNREWQQRL